MKKIVIGDAHAGVGDGSTLLMNHQFKVLNFITQYGIDNNIKSIIQTGDMFDVRKSTNTLVLSQWKEQVFGRWEREGFEIETIVSNHDMYYKNTIHPNSLTENLASLNNIRIYDKPTEVLQDVCGGTEILFVPWICKDNEQECLDAIKNTKAEICVLHPEIKGARMESGVCTEGLPLAMFDKFKTVIAGHFHTRGEYGAVTYVGTPYQTSWGDYGCEKGFHVLDTDTCELEFIPLDFNLFYRFSYDEDKDMDYILNSNLNGKYVKIVIENRSDFKKYDKFMDALEDKCPRDLKVIEPLMSLDSEDSLVNFDGKLEVKETEELIVDYINDLYPEKKAKLSKMMLGIHAEARVLC